MGLCQQCAALATEVKLSYFAPHRAELFAATRQLHDVRDGTGLLKTVCHLDWCLDVRPRDAAGSNMYHCFSGQLCRIQYEVSPGKNGSQPYKTGHLLASEWDALRRNTVCLSGKGNDNGYQSYALSSSLPLLDLQGAMGRFPLCYPAKRAWRRVLHSPLSPLAQPRSVKDP